jgi:hypothetical protein
LIGLIIKFINPKYFEKIKFNEDEIEIVKVQSEDESYYMHLEDTKDIKSEQPAGDVDNSPLKDSSKHQLNADLLLTVQSNIVKQIHGRDYEQA